MWTSLRFYRPDHVFRRHLSKAALMNPHSPFELKLSVLILCLLMILHMHPKRPRPRYNLFEKTEICASNIDLDTFYHVLA